MGTPPSAWRSGPPKKTSRRLRQGWNSRFAIRTRLGRALVATFWHEMTRKGRVVPISHGEPRTGHGEGGLNERLLRTRHESRIRRQKSQAPRKLREIFLWVSAGERSVAVPCSERDEGQRDGSLLIELTTKLSGEMRFQEFKRRHVFFAVEGDGQSSEMRRKSLGMGRKEVENAAATCAGVREDLMTAKRFRRARRGGGRADSSLLGEALIESRGSGARGAGDGTHG